MLTIKVALGDERVIETKDGVEFVDPEYAVLELEHSLVSLSTWEAKWEKPFLSTTDKTDEETYSYIEAMLLTPNVSPDILLRISAGNINDVNDYINRKMTATWFRESKDNKKSQEVITSELIYYWMIALNIPIECETWHLNRLITLVRVCNQKNSPQKKMTTQEAMAQQRALNAQRRAEMGTNG